PSEIPVIVMTHLHLDHTSAISEFPKATFVVSEVEWQEATHGRRPTLNGYRRVHLHLAFHYPAGDFDRGRDRPPPTPPPPPPPHLPPRLRPLRRRLDPPPLPPRPLGRPHVGDRSAEGTRLRDRW